MIFKISSEEQTISLDQEQLFTQILTQAFKEKQNEKLLNVEEYISTIERMLVALNTSSSNLDVTFKQIYTIYFLCGYYYKVFMTNNNVELIKKEK